MPAELDTHIADIRMSLDSAGVPRSVDESRRWKFAPTSRMALQQFVTGAVVDVLWGIDLSGLTARQIPLDHTPAIHRLPGRIHTDTQNGFDTASRLAPVHWERCAAR